MPTHGSWRYKVTYRILICVIAFLIVLAATGCSDALTGSSGEEPAPAPATVPPVSLKLDGYQGTVLRSICLDVVQSFYPPLGGVSEGRSLPVEKQLRPVLEELGMEVVGAAEPCDASMAVSLVGRSKAGKYCPGTMPSACSNPEICYESGSIEVSKELAIAGETIHVDDFEKSWDPQGTLITTCLKEPSLAAFQYKWSADIVDWLVELWGPLVYSRLIAADAGMSFSTTSDTFEALDPDPELIAELIVLLDEHERTPRASQWHSSASVLGYMGPAAMDAVPALLRGADELDWPTSGQWAAKVRAALERITGQDFGMNGEAWHRWWAGRE